MKTLFRLKKVPSSKTYMTNEMAEKVFSRGYVEEKGKIPLFFPVVEDKPFTFAEWLNFNEITIL